MKEAPGQHADGGQPVVLRDVRFAYPGMEFAFDLTVPAERIAVIIGPSGAGKSTLLDLVAGFARPRSGRILIGGVDVTDRPPAARPVSAVFQENNLFAHLDVAANVGLGRRPDLRLTAEDRMMVAGAIARVGLASKEARKPGELSGGERQRVAVARVLVRRRPVVILDEPFASLGPALRENMIELLAELHAETRMTVLMVSHVPDDALRLSADLIFIEGGRIAAQGPAGELLAPGGPAILKAYLGRGGSAIAV
jgi:thiamine transport system ATP-binding protein